MGKTMKKPHSYNLDDDLIADVNRVAAESGLSASELVGKILRGALTSRSDMVKELESIDMLDLVRKLKVSLKGKAK